MRWSATARSRSSATAFSAMVRGLPDDVFFKVGLIAIIGLSAKNAILIIEFARSLPESGRDLVEATRKQAPFKPSELVLREILCIASAVMDETFLSDFSSPDSETEDPIS